MLEKKEERFIRWQKIQIEQMSFIINLIIGLSVAILAFFATLLSGTNFILEGCIKIIFDLSMILIFLSIIFGIWLSINRLYDFKFTKDITKLKLHNEIGSKNKISNLETKTDKVGNFSWVLLYFQLISFVLSILLFLIFLSLKYNLFCF